MSEANTTIIRRGFKYRLRTRPQQEAQLRRHAGCCRKVWNLALARQDERHAAGEKYAGYVEMAKWLTAWRAAEDTAFLREAPVHALQSTLKDLDAAFVRFFKKAGGRPKFKRYGDRISFSEPDRACFAVDEANARVRLPKMGWMRYRASRPLDGQARNITVSLDALGWHVAIQTEDTVQPIQDATAIGAGDRGVTHFLAQADGTLTAPLNAHKAMLYRLRRYQRACARKVEAQKKAIGITGAIPKGMRLPVSNRLSLARLRLARMQAKIARERADFLHKLSTSIASEHAVFILEDLKVASMSHSAAGTAKAPGRCVRQKAGLNRSILDQGWHLFQSQLQYKLAHRGGELLLINPAYTSQRCHCCGHTEEANRRGKRFACLACGNADHADINAAKNILAAGHAVLAGRNPVHVDVEDAAQSGLPKPAEPSGLLRKRQPAGGAELCVS